MRIEACFDSHVHWAGTGEFFARLRLEDLSRPEGILNLKPEPHHFRGDWLLGFGWNENLWNSIPHRRVLDEWMPNVPVALSRCDGHALWVNSEALRRAGLLDTTEGHGAKGGRVERDVDGSPTGVLVDHAMDLVQVHIPPVSAFELRRHLLKAVQIFNEAGFTHIRDMTCDEAQWNEAVHLDESGLLTLAVEEYFRLSDISKLEEQIELARRARAQATQNLRVMGLKLFLDGALGSEGAWISRCYQGRDHQGLVLWDLMELEEVLLQCWQKELHVAVHVIGDEAADQLIRVAVHLKDKGYQGKLHLEHAEILRTETISRMKGLQVQCHLQPAHWLSDRNWLRDKVGDLSELAFPWRRLQEAAVPFDFGSDAPIEPASISRTLRALNLSAEHGVPRLLGSPQSHMGHPDLAWAPNSYTLLDEDRPSQVVFRGEHLL
ncbi:MAG: amidohydrolase [Bdellovibrionales bacterium]